MSATTCVQCGKPHNRRRFCSNACKDRYHNTHSPRGFGLTLPPEEDEIHEAGMDASEAGWDGHKGAF